jgi:hypothetical protein
MFMKEKHIQLHELRGSALYVPIQIQHNMRIQIYPPFTRLQTLLDLTKDDHLVSSFTC